MQFKANAEKATDDKEKATCSRSWFYVDAVSLGSKKMETLLDECIDGQMIRIGDGIAHCISR